MRFRFIFKKKMQSKEKQTKISLSLWITWMPMPLMSTTASLLTAPADLDAAQTAIKHVTAFTASGHARNTQVHAAAPTAKAIALGKKHSLTTSLSTLYRTTPGVVSVRVSLLLLPIDTEAAILQGSHDAAALPFCFPPKQNWDRIGSPQTVISADADAM